MTYFNATQDKDGIMTCPKHYKPTIEGAPEPWDVFHELHMEHSFSNALKYVLRHDRKENPEKDLQKALHCLEKSATLKTPFPMRPFNNPCREKTIFWPMVHGQGDERFLKCGHMLSQFMASMEQAAINYLYGWQLDYEIYVGQALLSLRKYIASRKTGALRARLESAHAALAAALQACPADGLSVPKGAMVHMATASSLLEEAALLTGGAEKLTRMRLTRTDNTGEV